MPRVFPAQAMRVETGAVQFGDDWPGVFIRGDNALHFAMVLREALLGQTLKLFWHDRVALEGLRELLFSADHRRPVEGVPVMKLEPVEDGWYWLRHMEDRVWRLHRVARQAVLLINGDWPLERFLGLELVKVEAPAP